VQAGWKPLLFAAGIALACAAGVAFATAQNAQATQVAGNHQTSVAPNAPVDINHATASQLMTIPGMTATWAGRIVRFRPYRTKQDLIDKGVVTSQVYDRIKDYVIAHRDKQ
jgi:competence protein ComEA